MSVGGEERAGVTCQRAVRPLHHALDNVVGFH